MSTKPTEQLEYIFKNANSNGQLIRVKGHETKDDVIVIASVIYSAEWKTANSGLGKPNILKQGSTVAEADLLTYADAQGYDLFKVVLGQETQVQTQEWDEQAAPSGLLLTLVS